jgi:hypothetical protein
MVIAQYPIVVFEVEGDSAMAWVLESEADLLCFLEEFADCLEDFILWDATARRVLLQGIRQTEWNEESQRRLWVSDVPDPGEFLALSNRSASRRGSGQLTSTADAIAFLRG